MAETIFYYALGCFVVVYAIWTIAYALVLIFFQIAHYGEALRFGGLKFSWRMPFIILWNGIWGGLRWPMLMREFMRHHREEMRRRTSG